MSNKLNELLNMPKDDVVTFEELGTDFIIVDEAHMFKNLPTFSKMRNVAGVNNSESKKATDLFMKTSYVLENNDRVVVFTDELSGGPKMEWISKTATSRAKKKIKEYNKNKI